MDAFQRIQELFYECIALQSRGAQQRFLEALRDGPDDALIPRLAALIEADRMQEERELPVPAANPLQQFGPYRAQRVLGRGGMGVVYLARRDDGQYEQMVAVKVISSSIDPVRGVSDFRRERQILAGLRHPGIASLLEGGVTDDGMPYIVMEYVDGEPLSDYCGNRKLSIAARIELVRTICQAVAYAHRNLVIHRDLKPSNILVTAEGQPKLLDFGTARLVEAEDHTATQGMLTPRYASPEQLRSQPISTSTDLFALGVILAELLTGRWPFGDPSSQADALRRAVEDVEPTPLDRDITSKHAEDCSTPIRKVQQELRGDLSAIVARCLESNADRRYRTVEEFSEDLRRYLAGEPVAARPQTAIYRMTKFVRRHAAAVSAVAIAMVALAGMAVYSMGQARQARSEANRAITARMAMDRLFTLVKPDPDAKLRDMSNALEALLAKKGVDPELRVDLLFSGASWSFATTEFTRGVGQLREAVREARKVGDPLGEGMAAAKLSTVLVQIGELTEAEELARATLRLPRPSNASAARIMHASALYAILWSASWGKGVPPDIDTFIAQAQTLDPNDPLIRSGLASMYELIAGIRGSQGRKAEELEALKAGLKYFRESPTADSALILESWRKRLMRDGDYPGAEAFARERLDLNVKTYGPDHLATGHARLYRARVLVLLGRQREALEESLLALKAYDLVGPERGRPIDWLLFTTLALAYNETGKPKDAETYAHKAVELDRQMDMKKDARVAEAHLGLGYALRQQSSFEPAAKELALARDIYTAAGERFARRVQEAAEQLALASARDASRYPKHMR